MEDVAKDYVNELINRNMIQIEEYTADGQVLACKIHDLVRDLVIEKAREQKILGIFDSSKQHPNPISLLQGQARHAIYTGIGEYFKLLGPNSDNINLRSLALTTDSLKVEEIKLMYTRFQYLKVLNMTSVIFSEGIPEEIGDLVLLKFLGLTGCLRTLHGSNFLFTTYVFSKEICELKELRNLIFDKPQIPKENLNIGNDQTKLQTITWIIYKEWRHIDTIKLTNLYTLGITSDLEEEDYSLESIANLTNLRTLFLELKKGVTIQPLSSCKYLNKVSLVHRIEDPALLRSLTPVPEFYDY